MPWSGPRRSSVGWRSSRLPLAASPPIDRVLLLQLAHDLPAAWNAAADTRSKQRLLHIVIQEIVCNLDDATNEAVLSDPLDRWTP